MTRQDDIDRIRAAIEQLEAIDRDDWPEEIAARLTVVEDELSNIHIQMSMEQTHTESES